MQQINAIWGESEISSKLGVGWIERLSDWESVCVWESMRMEESESWNGKGRERGRMEEREIDME